MRDTAFAAPGASEGCPGRGAGLDLRRSNVVEPSCLDTAAVCVRRLLGDVEGLTGIAASLSASLRDPDPFCRRARRELEGMGLDNPAALKLLASFRSRSKYDCEIASATLDHVVNLASRGAGKHAVRAPFDRPFILLKACWLYEHSPYFVFPATPSAAERNRHILDFGQDYLRRFVEQDWDLEAWETRKPTKRVRRTGFWDDTALDPVALIKRASDDGLEGIELSVDFHPFNSRRLLPEEIPAEKREQIRRAAEVTGLRLDLHSPLVGPYTPSPNPAQGSQRFFDPTTCLTVQKETIRLAFDLGAEAVVFHLIDPASTPSFVELIDEAAGSDLRITVENYCQVESCRQTSEVFLRALKTIREGLGSREQERNFGVTLDVGHLNIEGEDPLVGAERIGRWCLENNVYLRIHATDNYGRLLFDPPHYSADVHANVAGKGINNGDIIRMLRSMGLTFPVVAEQIKPLSVEDVDTIHAAQTDCLGKTFDEFVEAGRKRLAEEKPGEFLTEAYCTRPVHRFLAGIHGVHALQEYAVYRQIQDQAHLSVDEARKISGDFSRMSTGLKGDLTTYMDDLLLPVQSEAGAEGKTQLDLVCQNISGSSFWISGAKNVDHIFTTERIYHQGDIICEQNDPGRDMYYIKTGRVNVAIDGSRVATLGPGEIFGEISLFYSVPRSATIQAVLYDTRVGVLDRDDLEKLFECKRPAVHDVILRLYRALPDRLRNMNEKYRAAIRTLELVSEDCGQALREIEESALSGPFRPGRRVLPTFSSADINQIAESKPEVKAGETIVELGDEGDGVYFVISGKVRVTVPGAKGEVLLGEVGPGAIFGEMALIDSKPRSARVGALTDCELAFTSRNSFELLIGKESSLAYRLMGFICSGMFERILRLDSVYAEIKRRHRALAAKARQKTEQLPTQDIIQTVLEHRLRQSDLDRLLKELSTTNRDRLINKIGELLRRISALVEVSSRMSDTLSLDLLLPRLMEVVGDALGVERSTLFLNDPETNELYSRVTQGNEVDEIRFPNHLGIAGSVFTNSEPIIIADAYSDPRFNPEVDRKTGFKTRNILCTPLKNKGKTTGVAQVLNKRGGDFDNNDLRLLEALTSQAASALENARLYETVEKARREEAHLLEITSAIASELHLETLLERVVRATTEMLDADRGTLFMFDPETDELWSRVAEGLTVKEIRFPAGAGIAGHCFSSGEVVNIPDAYRDPRFNPEVDRKTGYRTHSILCMPVANKNGQKLAVFQVLNKRGGPFGPLDERRLQSFSAQVAIALENAQLFQDIMNEKNYNESILKSLSNGVITLDGNRRITKLNEAAIHIMRWREEDVVNRPIATVMHAKENAWVLDSLEKVAATGEVDLTVDAEVRTGDEQTVSVNLTVVPLVDVSEDAIGSMLVFEDITSEKRMKSAMARYMTKEVADRLLEGGQDALGGVSQVVTVLFSDIRGFTTISERLGARKTVSLLNEYFTCMVDVIFEYGGILDKYMADGIMALFGTPFPGEQDADNAVAVGNEMIRALTRFNRTRKTMGEDEFRIGVGLSTGELVAGNIGSPKRMDYTVIGDPANLASRLESATKYYRVEVLLSELTLNSLKHDIRYRPLDSIRVVGKLEPVAIFEALDHHTPETFPNMEATVTVFEKGFASYRRRDWAEALKSFRQALDLRPGDGPSALYEQRCLRFLEEPPDDSWDGVLVMDHK